MLDAQWHWHSGSVVVAQWRWFSGGGSVAVPDLPGGGDGDEVSSGVVGQPGSGAARVAVGHKSGTGKVWHSELDLTLSARRAITILHTWCSFACRWRLRSVC